jgi:hypothetical protein
MDTHDGRFVEMPYTVAGMRFLQSLRKGRADLFRQRRIRVVVQHLPDKVPVGQLVSITCTTEGL